MSATDSGPLPMFTTRRCRGHWHVLRSGAEDDIALAGDPFATQAEAQRRVDVLNAGGSFADADALDAPSPVPPPEVGDEDVELAHEQFMKVMDGASNPFTRKRALRLVLEDFASRRAASPVGDAVDVVLDAALRDFQRGSEIGRLKAALAKAQSTKSETVEKYERWLAEAAEHDVATLSDWSNDALAETLEYTRNYAPSGCHAALNVAASRLRASPSPASAPDFEAEVREAIATLDASGFPGGFRTEGNPTFEAAVARIVAASRPASAPGKTRFTVGHAIGLHMVIELARSVELTGDERADANIRNALARAREGQEWLEPLARTPRADTGGKGSRCVHSDGNACEQYRLQGQRCQDCPESGGAK